MSIQPVIPEVLWPSLIVGGIYRLKPTDTGGQFVRIIDIDFDIVYAEGVYPHIASFEVPIERFYNILGYTGYVY